MKRKILFNFSACVVALLCSVAAAHAAELSFKAGDGSLTLNTVRTFMLLSVLSVAPGILMTITCFPFMLIVLASVRQALGAGQTPPNMLLASLAVFLTGYVMEPVFSKAWQEGIHPYIEGSSTEEDAFDRTLEPFRVFMEKRTDLKTSAFLQEAASAGKQTAGERLPVHVLIPAYMLTEIQRAFKIAFIIFIPFVIIDLVVSSLLMATGMMMLPPAGIALPVKLAFFTLSDGWTLLSSALVRSYN